MAFSPYHTEEKPYNRCIDCMYIGKSCDGPNFLAMDIRRLCEWARLRKEYLHSKDPKWTNAYIANCSDVSLGTVNRVLSGEKVDDLRLSTAAMVVKVLVDGTWGQYPCSLAAGEEDAEVECAHLRALLVEEQKKTAYLKEQASFKDRQLEEKDLAIKEYYRVIRRRSNLVFVFAVAFFLTLLAVIAALLIDAVTPDVGFIWADRAGPGAVAAISVGAVVFLCLAGFVAYRLFIFHKKR